MKAFIYVLYELILGNIVKILGISLVITILLQIAGRFILPHPLSWTEELARFLFIWFGFLGSVITLKRKMHLGIEILYQKFTGRNKKMLDTIIQMFIILFGVILFINGLKLVEIGNIQKSPVMRWPMSYFYSAIPVTGLLILIYSLFSLVKIFQNTSEQDKKV
ncbi:TRAP transporter small permease [Gracilibacillus sp. YIM 98692]|uniref:TRAP transporter small permease n=1 Tax=Gracilibacillus sp. YIM 98692 TaxID=2663532 RepID=UPI0013D56AF1|nr:TRAP transporter small permease [Gracilibacillus sp. YIM 98692]